MLSVHPDWDWQLPQTASLIHIRHIQSVWAHWYVVHGHTVAALHSHTHTTWIRFWGSGSLMWIKNDVITSWLRLLSYSNCLMHPCWTCTKFLSILICFPLTSLVTALNSFTHRTRLRLWGSVSLVESTWCHLVMVEADSYLKLLPLSKLNICELFEPIDILSIGIR